MKKNFFTQKELLKLMSCVDYSLYQDKSMIQLNPDLEYTRESIEIQLSIISKLKLLYSESFDEVNNE